MTNHIAILVQGFQLFVTTAIGIFVAFVAWRQWKTAKDKLTLDLFKERFDVYKQIADAVELSTWDATAAADACEQIFSARRRCRFLFGDDVTTIVDDIAGMAFDMKAHVSLRDNEQFHANAPELVREQGIKIAIHPMTMRKSLDRLTAACESYMRMTSKAD